MAKKQGTIKFRVQGSGQFPFDMLRYDGAYPADQSASARIDDTCWHRRETSGAGQVPVELVATHNGAPTVARWLSFGWQVTHVWNGYEWESYEGQRVTK